ncbi:GFA family protein [Steroidobacter sp.]|uniref:GFA family protein n=1 Tax=Steroidobacter sp. TaxID=1978227 RepID=UPI001A395C16|nr:GFA family protein [Steroidobacter sp.]MBL8269453.1 GFA family protein [Steroidobacter sp.]
MKYTGSCHCGLVKFEFESSFDEVIECNCSHCSRKGYLLTFVPHEQFQLRSGEENLRVYTFNRHVIHHHFCKTCGCAPYGIGSNPKGGKMAAINVRCLEDFDLAAVKRKAVDGKSF